MNAWKCRGECKRETVAENNPGVCCGMPFEPRDCVDCGRALRRSLRIITVEGEQSDGFKSCPMCSARAGHHVMYPFADFLSCASRAHAGEDTGPGTNCKGCNFNKALDGVQKEMTPAVVDCRDAKKGRTSGGKGLPRKVKTKVVAEPVQEKPEWEALLKGITDRTLVSEVNAGWFNQADRYLGEDVRHPFTGSEGKVSRVFSREGRKLVRVVWDAELKAKLVG